MMQRHHRLEATPQQGIDDLLVVSERRLVPVPRPRLNTTPLNGKAMGVVPQGASKVEVGLVKMVMTTGLARSMRQQAHLFRCPPVVVDVVPLHLVGGRSGTQQQRTVWQCKKLFR